MAKRSRFVAHEGEYRILDQPPERDDPQQRPASEVPPTFEDIEQEGDGGR